MKLESLFETSNIQEDSVKLAYLIHALEGNAGLWLQAEINAGRFTSKTEGVEGTWAGFREAFLKLYASELTTEVARTKLDNLVKGKQGSVSPHQLQGFIAQYRSLATRVNDRSDGDLKAGFINCMGPTIKGFLLTLHLPTLELKDVIDKSVEFATRNNTYTTDQSSYQKGKKDQGFHSSGRQRYWDHQPGKGAAAGGGASSSEPMELGAISKENLPRFKNVSASDVSSRFEEGLCLYCGKGPHRVQECRSLLRDDPKHPVLVIKAKEGNGETRGKKPPPRDKQ